MGRATSKRPRKLRRPYCLIGAGIAVSPFSVPVRGMERREAPGLARPLGEALRSAPPRARRSARTLAKGAAPPSAPSRLLPTALAVAQLRAALVGTCRL